MTFIGERPSIKHKCRAPLESGKLCPRMDLEKCPFHGPIVPRDEIGFPIDELGKGQVKLLKRHNFILFSSVKDIKLANAYLEDTTEMSKKGKRANKNSVHGTARKREKTKTVTSRERLFVCFFIKLLIIDIFIEKSVQS